MSRPKQVNFNADEKLLEEVRKCAEYHGLAVSQVIRMLIKQEYRRISNE